ncbi:sulfotransferase family 2 domain-containing protein [Vibrio cyclitrophicus]
MNKFKYSGFSLSTLHQNGKHGFAISYSMMLYAKNSLYTFIPKNACSTLRLSTAIENGCIECVEQGHWIHANNQTFNATLGEALKVDYSFVVLRCPFRRLASVYLDKFVAKEPDAWQYRENLQRKVELDDLTFRDFVLSLKNPAIFNSNIHWRKQGDFLLFEEYSDYFALEKFSDAIGILKEKIDFNVVDARSLTNHGTHHYQMLTESCFADTSTFDIAVMKRQGQCPSHAALYDKSLYALVSELYQSDIQLYKDKCKASDLLSIDEVVSPILDINTVTLADIQYHFDVDFLRDEAVRLESTDLSLAFKLMGLALEARPDGPFIKQKYEEYAHLLQKA